ncbi:MAG: hypothetical protein LIO43_04855 [Clostridiales bacterium]|nr:hypothetical protein [Clostridiales bacterium]
MKKLFCLLLTVLMLCALASCGNKENGKAPSGTLPNNTTPSSSTSQVQPAEEEESKAETSESVQSTGSADVDITKLSSTMVYSEVYNMMYAHDDYVGKTVKMRGQFAYYEDPETKAQYFACIIADATACCSQGLEFVLAGEHTYPDDYPELGSEITVTGTFELHEEGNFQYCQLADAEMIE